MKRFVTLPLVAAVVVVGGCGDANQPNQPGEAQPGVTCEYPSSGEPARPVDPPSTKDVPSTGTATATLHMEAGDVEITLERAKAPCAVNSFLSLAEQGFYDNTQCHRLVEQGIFVLQCGDPTATGTGGPGYVMAEELTKETAYPAGTVAMARTKAPTTTGSQFFLVWADTDLRPEYTVVGQMDAQGIDVVGRIAAQGVDAKDGITPLGEAGIKDVVLG